MLYICSVSLKIYTFSLTWYLWHTVIQSSIRSFLHLRLSFLLFLSGDCRANSVASPDSDKRVGVSARWWSGPLRNLIVKDDRANASIFPAALPVSHKNLFLAFYYFLFRRVARRLGHGCFVLASQRNITTISILADIADR